MWFLLLKVLLAHLSFLIRVYLCEKPVQGTRLFLEDWGASFSLSQQLFHIKGDDSDYRSQTQQSHLQSGQLWDKRYQQRRGQQQPTEFRVLCLIQVCLPEAETIGNQLGRVMGSHRAWPYASWAAEERFPQCDWGSPCRWCIWISETKV